MSNHVSSPKSTSRDLRLLWTAVFCLMFGFGVYNAIYYNWLTEVIHIKPDSLGWVEAIRETPGFLCMIAAAITMQVAEPIVGSVAFLVMAGGIGAYAGIHGVFALALWSFIWSLGFHMWQPLSSSMALNLAGKDDKGKRLGQMAGVGALGSLIGMIAVLAVSMLVVVHNKDLMYRLWFLVGAGSIAIAAFLLLGIRKDIGHADKPRFVMKRKYRPYYYLTLLEGCRKQVFMTFAIYALTKEYHASLRIVALLMVINGIVNMIGAPIVGRLIDRIGERKILTTSYSALIFVFLGYAMIHHAHWLYVMYCLDNLLYLSTTCLTTYLQKIAEPEDLMPTLSVGVSFNHTAAVLVPLIGGYLWARFSYPVTFYGGAVVVAISLLLAQKVGTKKRVEA